MQAQSIRRTVPSYYTNSAGARFVEYQQPVFIHENSGWPVIRGNHKTPLPHKYSIFTSSGSGRFVWTTAPDDWSTHDVGCPKACGLPDPSVAYNIALGELNDKIRGGLDLSVDAFQARQTGRMFSAASQAEDLARGLRRSGVGKLRLIGSLWLQFQYGWLPTLGSVYGTADESLRYVINNLSTYTGKGYTHNVGSITPTDGWYAVPSNFEDSAAVTLSVTVDNSKVINLSRWTSLNPVSIGWELLPFSFVVDWFYDVGNTLRNAETALLYGRAFAHGYKSEFLRRKTTQKPSFTKVYRGQQVWSGNGASNNRSFKREVLSSFPFPSTPKLKFSLGSRQLLNAAALLSQFLK